MSDHYIPDENWNPIPCDPMTWANWLENGERHLKETEIHHGPHTITVSTVFLGLDHSFGGKVPVLYETMAYVDEPNTIGVGTEWEKTLPITFIEHSQVRASTKEEALKNHDEVVELIHSALPPWLQETPWPQLLG